MVAFILDRAKPAKMPKLRPTGDPPKMPKKPLK